MTFDVELGPPPPPPARSRAAIGWVVALSVALALAIAGGVWLVLEVQRLQAANESATRLVDEQQRLIDEQVEMLDEQRTFGAAMEDVLAKARSLDGLPIGTILSLDELDELARAAWDTRRSPASVASLTTTVQERAAALDTAIGAAAAQLASSSGSLGESLVNSLAAGHVRVVYDDPASLCGGDPIGCVSSDDPTLIHLDPSDFYAEHFDDELRTLVTYHEFGHVLQFTNPGPTERAAAAFEGDWEFMADCYALTATDSDSLERRVWRDSSSYWDVSVGYGRVCDTGQREVIRTWLGELGFHYRPVSQAAA